MNQNSNTLDRETLLGQLADMKREIKQLREFVYGSQISSARIKNLRWDKGQGGSLTLGGLNDVNGVLSLLNAAGDEKILLDKDGILIRDGNIIIENEDSTTILDQTGLVSSANFPTAEINDNTIRTTVSTSYVDVPGSSFDPFTLERSTRVLLLVTLSGYNINWLVNGSTMSVSMYSSISGNLLSFPVFIEHRLTQVDASFDLENADLYFSADYQTKSIVAITTLPAGTHNLKLQFKVVGTGTAEIGAYIAGYIVLGS